MIAPELPILFAKYHFPFIVTLLVSRYFPLGIDWLNQTHLAPSMFALLEYALPLLPAHFSVYCERHYRELLP